MHRLTELADKHKSDKGALVGSATGFALIYEYLLGHLSNEKVKILEIGLNNGGPEHGSDRFYRIIKDCPSIKMWHEYFSKGDIWGFDINDVDETLLASLKRFRFFKGDQGNIESYKKFKNLITKTYGENDGFDIIIDDGSHAFYHQQMSFAHLSEHVKPSGFYVIEDLYWQPNKDQGGDKAGGTAPFDVSKLPKTVNTRKLFDAIYIGPQNNHIQYKNRGAMSYRQLKGDPNIPWLTKEDLLEHIDLLRARRPEYADILFNESRQYDRITVSASALPDWLPKFNYKAILILRKRKENEDVI